MENRDHHALRALLADALSRKRSQNPRYSLRAFARDTGLNPPELSEFLKGKRGLSDRKIHYLARSPSFSEPERFKILSLIGMPSFAARGEQIELSIEQFQVIADWVHFAIFAMIESDPRLPSRPARIAKRLNVPVDRVRDAVLRLVQLGYLVKSADGEWGKSVPMFFVKSTGRSEALREFNLAMLEKTREAATNVSANERHAASSTVCVSRRDMPLARTLIDAFIQQFTHRLSTANEEKEEVFHLNIHYFSLEKGK